MVETESKTEFPHFPSVLKMLQSAGDFEQLQGNLKMLSDSPLHIQVSNWVFEGDPAKVIQEQVKRDIIYVCFQAFAETDVDELTITSVPLKMKDIKTKDKYLNKYKKTVTVNRDTARKILSKHLQISNFRDLYYLNETLWLPNDNFSQLKFKKLDLVFADLTKFVI